MNSNSYDISLSMNARSRNFAFDCGGMKYIQQACGKRRFWNSKFLA